MTDRLTQIRARLSEFQDENTNMTWNEFSDTAEEDIAYLLMEVEKRDVSLKDLLRWVVRGEAAVPVSCQQLYFKAVEDAQKLIGEPND